MSLMFVAAMMMAQAPAATTPPATAQKKKPHQVCQMMEVTGSRSRKRVCRDENGQLDLGPGISNTFGTKGTTDQRGPSVGGPAGPGAGN